MGRIVGIGATVTRVTVESVQKELNKKVTELEKLTQSVADLTKLNADLSENNKELTDKVTELEKLTQPVK